MLFPRVLLYKISYYKEVVSVIIQKRVTEKREVWNVLSLIAPLIWYNTVATGAMGFMIHI